MKRAILIILKIFISSVVILAGFIFFIIATNLGAQISLNVFANVIPGILEVSHVEGKLGSDVTLKDLFYRDQNIQIVVQELHISWQPWKLFDKRLVINELNSKNIKINLVTPKQSRKGNKISLLGFLKYTSLYHLNVKHLLFTQDSKAYAQIDELQLTRHADSTTGMFLKSNFGEMRGTIALNIDPSPTWMLKLQAANLDFGKLFPNFDSQINFYLDSKGIWNSYNKKVVVQLTELNGKFKTFPLKGFVSLNYDNGELTLTDSRIYLGNSQATASGILKENWDIKWDLNIPQLDNILPNVLGHLSSSGSILGSKNNPELRAEIKASQLSFANVKIDDLKGTLFSNLTSPYKTLTQFTVSNINVADYIFSQMKFKSDSQFYHEKLVSSVALSLSDDNQIQGKIILPKFTNVADMHQPVEGKIAVNFKHLNELLAKIPEVKNLQGNVEGQIGINGYLDQPVFSVNALLSKGQLFISKLGITINDIIVRAAYVDDLIKLSGNFSSGKGTGRINGTLDLNRSGMPSQLKLQGENLQIFNLPEYKIEASPNLTLHYDNQLDIQGNVFIPFANIATKDLSNVVTLPNEVVFVHPQQTIPSSTSSLPATLSMHLQIVLGDKIHLQYENLSASLGGKVVILQNAGSPATATGELYAIKGKYRAYGKSLTIQNGRLLYAGNILTNPGLDIRAIQKIETVGLSEQTNLFSSNNELKPIRTGTQTVTVGVWVRGTLDKPELTLFSDPSGMGKNDVISYLVFGYPQSEITKSSSLALLNNVASNLNLGGSNVTGSTEKIKKKLGLSELNVGSREIFDPSAKNYTTNATTFTVGKKLGRNLYLRYSVGLFDQVQILNLKYQITKNLSLQSETSTFKNNTDNGADLLYEFERD